MCFLYFARASGSEQAQRPARRSNEHNETTEGQLFPSFLQLTNPSPKTGYATLYHTSFLSLTIGHNLSQDTTTCEGGQDKIPDGLLYYRINNRSLHLPVEDKRENGIFLFLTVLVVSLLDDDNA